jgi:hypothetical protein
MLDAWNRIEHNRHLAYECHRLATRTLSSQMKKRYLLMAKDYTLLADIEKHERAYYTRLRLRKMPRTSERLP